MNYQEINSKSWDEKVDDGNGCTVPVSSQEVENARNGKWDIIMTPNKHVPKSWFPSLNGKNVLVIGGGGQQGPILAAAGAAVTVFDLSRKQLEQDEFVAKRDNLQIKTVHGNCQDLSVFADGEFDLIVYLVGCWIDSYEPAWREAYRVLKKGGAMLAVGVNPVEFLFDLEKMEAGELVVRPKIPYSDLTSLEGEERDRITAKDGVAFGHTLHHLIQGQIDVGFLIAGFYEDNGNGTILDEYIDMYFATKAIKL